MREKIIEEVKELCKVNGVDPMFIFFTGSRAYGYNKEDSDYDVLFVFKRPTADYFRVHPLADELKVEGKDVKGWDLRKFCSILCKSGWNAHEALHCRAVFPFEGYYGVFAHLREIVTVDGFYEPMKVAKTMIGCSARDLAKYEAAEGNKKLKYFLSYTRMIMSAMYCTTHDKYPPVNFLTLTNVLLTDEWDREVMKTVVTSRKKGIDDGFYLPALETLVERFKTESERIKEMVKKYDYKTKDESMMKLMDEFLYQTLA